MVRVTEETFEDGAEIIRVYLAGSLSEAQSVEQALDAAGVDYLAETESFASPGLLGPRQRTGVGFWVLTAALDAAAEALTRAGLTSGLVKR